MFCITMRDRKRALWIREQTKVEDILTTFKIVMLKWAGHIMEQTDKIWTVRVTKWLSRNGKIKQLDGEMR